MNWLRSLFCRHRAIRFVRNIHGDEINAWSLNRIYRSLWRCERCGRLVPKPELIDAVLLPSGCRRS